MKIVYWGLVAIGAALALSACDMDKNISLCGQLGMCPKDKPDDDPMCEHYGTCKKEDGEEEEKEKPEGAHEQ